MTRALPLFVLVLLGACDGGKSKAELATLNRELVARADPAITASLEDPIMSDRDLTVADDSRRVRLVGGPAQAAYPARIRSNAAVMSALQGLAREPHCERGFTKSGDWVARMPSAFALYPGATLVEAAGNDRAPCRSRVLAFRTAAAPPAVIGWYRARALAAGYGAEVRPRGADRVVAGTRARDGAGYYLVASPADGGAEVALIATGG